MVTPHPASPATAAWLRLWIVLGCSVVAGRALAGPQDWFASGVKDCQRSVAAGNQFSCNICGVGVSCAGQTCSFGDLTARIDNPAEQMTALQRGFDLYCTGSGGAILNAASASAVQLQTLSNMFRAARNGIPNRTAGGVVEVKSSVAGTSGGFTLPASWGWRLGARSNLELPGNLIVGFGEVKQVGFNINPTYTRLLRGQLEGEKTRVLMSASVPFQLVGLFGDGISTNASWAAGLGVGLGVARPWGRWLGGVGLTMDFRYAAAPFLPTTLAGTLAYDLHRLVTLAGQIGLSFEPLAGSNIADTIKPTLLVGAEFGKWILGYQGSFQSGAVSNGFALAYVGSA